jgi:hypothetical protein
MSFRRVDEVDQYLAEGLTTRIVEFVTRNPGTIQKQLHATLGADTQSVQFACYMLATVGRTLRAKQGTELFADDSPMSLPGEVVQNRRKRGHSPPCGRPR